MDFSTHFNLADRLPKIADIGPADWLRLAVAAAAARENDQIFARGCYPDNAQALRRDALSARRYRNAPSAHTYLEICLSLIGAASMVMDEKAFRFQSPGMAIFQPGVTHCEGYVQANRRYALMWMIYTGASLMAAVCVYDPRNQWTCLRRWNIQSPSVQKLLSHFPASESGVASPLSPERKGRIRADLITLLGELLQKAAAPTPNKAARHGRHQHDAMLRNLQAFINNHLAEPLSVAYLASLAHMSPNYLNSLFVQWAGQPLRSYIISCRMKEARQLLQSGRWMVKEVAAKVGYDDPLYFSRAFRKFYDLWPTDIPAK